jgi:hypothetical protein
MGGELAFGHNATAKSVGPREKSGDAKALSQSISTNRDAAAMVAVGGAALTAFKPCSPTPR